MLGKKRSKDVKPTSVCTYRKGNNNNNKNDSYYVNKTFLSDVKRDGKEETLHPKVLCTRQHLVVLTEGRLIFF